MRFEKFEHIVEYVRILKNTLTAKLPKEIIFRAVL